MLSLGETVLTLVLIIHSTFILFSSKAQVDGYAQYSRQFQDLSLISLQRCRVYFSLADDFEHYHRPPALRAVFKFDTFRSMLAPIKRSEWQSPRIIYPASPSLPGMTSPPATTATACSSCKSAPVLSACLQLSLRSYSALLMSIHAGSLLVTSPTKLI